MTGVLSTGAGLAPQKSRAKQAFWIALLVAAALFLPFIILDRGYFIYYGDFNVQQLSFYQMAHDAIRSGDFSWSWTTDLGANFVGSYSFYLLGSPFFWLTMPFPSQAIPYLMAPLLALKFACASLFAYAYLQRFVSKDMALLGGLLYAFSGFSLYNIFFNHFHEAILYFPLMLFAMERHMKDHKRGLFAVVVLLSALNNYYFFIGQAVFLIIYWVVRLISHDWDVRVSDVFTLFLEAIVGTAGAAVLLAPAFFAVVQNNRVNKLIAGWNFLIYDKPQRFFDIIHSFFFLQDIPARENFFPDSCNKWASMSAWVPVFGCTGALAYYQSRKHTDWLKRMIFICVVCALIPGLNAMFQMFNGMYYARWFYMMVLMLVLATVTVLDQQARQPQELAGQEPEIPWQRALWWCFGITAAFTCFIGLMPQHDGTSKTEGWKFGLMKVPERFWVYVAIAMISLALTALLVFLLKREPKRFLRFATVIVCAMSLLSGWFLVGSGKAESNYTSDFVRKYALNTGTKIKLPTDGKTYVRVDFNKDMDNMGMFWKRPTIQAFHSIVPGSVMEFYPTIGVDRSVGSRPDSTHYALRSFLSVKWLFDFENTEKKEWKQKDDFFFADGKTKMPGWKYYNEQHDYRVYENANYIPMGYTYDSYLTREEYNDLSEQDRELVLLKALVVEKKDVAAVSPVLTHLDVNSTSFTEDQFAVDCEARAYGSASSFTNTNHSFTASISLLQKQPVFFSVPYEKGWTAKVNGKSAPILKTNVGFMSVMCDSGKDVKIEFEYHTPGLLLGLLVSGGALLVLGLYILLVYLIRRRRKPEEPDMPALSAPAEETPPIPETADTPSETENGQPEDVATASEQDDSMLESILEEAAALRENEDTGEKPASDPVSPLSPEDEFDLYSLYRSHKTESKDNTKPEQ